MEDGYQRIGSESEDRAPASWRKFFTILTGRTNGAHQSVVRTFKSVGQTEARSPGDADYCLAFCPVSSRVGTDVSEAMEHLPAGKAAVLVVMHHTFNPEQVIPPSRRVVTDPRVRLTLDCLFHQNKLLRCQLNRNMKNDIWRFFRSQSLLLPTVVRLYCRLFSSATLHMVSLTRYLVWAGCKHPKSLLFVLGAFGVISCLSPREKISAHPWMFYQDIWGECPAIILPIAYYL
ncbi:uncharacterized protein LOC115401726 [Salarias fasciatus]|uniref:uncharacterized protein LOC115401726 n=1 Tax=Salarias fasciatus TaxID=181472 RepID=UPI0011770BE1|nr:uncharacterized protein LOC115401726 [Salarias fasciatus]